MVFDGKHLQDINNDEIHTLVQENSLEHQHLEFKLTINNKDDKGKLELLHDIAAIANGGGGYLIIGIRDDGTGKALKYEPTLVGDVEAIKKSILDLAHEHIQERIIGLEVEARNINNNPIVIVRIPGLKEEQLPHMVTYKNRTDFVSRYQDGKKSMSIAEIHIKINKVALQQIKIWMGTAAVIIAVIAFTGLLVYAIGKGISSDA